jgi:hypothetical protein
MATDPTASATSVADHVLAAGKASLRKKLRSPIVANEACELLEIEYRRLQLAGKEGAEYVRELIACLHHETRPRDEADAYNMFMAAGVTLPAEALERARRQTLEHERECDELMAALRVTLKNRP